MLSVTQLFFIPVFVLGVSLAGSGFAADVPSHPPGEGTPNRNCTRENLNDYCYLDCRTDYVGFTTCSKKTCTTSGWRRDPLVCVSPPGRNECNPRC